MPKARGDMRDTTDTRNQILALVRRTGAHLRMEEPIQLASGEMSLDFIDGKLAVADPEDLATVGRAMAEMADARGISFDVVGGLALGAVPFTFAVALTAQKRWFVVRKEPKGRGTNRSIEGARIGEGTAVLLVDDVITTGGSIQKAYESVVETGATVACATTLVDRSDLAAEFFASRGVPYAPLLTYRDLDMEPVGHGSRAATASA